MSQHTLFVVFLLFGTDKYIWGMKLTVADLNSIRSRGINPDEIERQLQLFTSGIKPIQLIRPAVPDDGIRVLDELQEKRYAALFDEKAKTLDVVKFVPASGAATRMFKDLYEFAETGQINAGSEIFFSHLQDFAFYEKLIQQFGHGRSREELVRFLLGKEGFRFGELPKGLLPFHRYNSGSITPVESHIYEATGYSDLADGTLSVHFTMSPEHLHEAEQLIWKTVFELEDQQGIESFIQLSEQDASTDTIAVDENNEPLRDAEGRLVFRPGGHGSLLKNLAETDADLIFVRNIDNILPPDANAQNVFYKKVLGGILLELQRKVFDAIEQIEKNDGAIQQAINFIHSEFGLLFPDQSTKDELMRFLSRPIRVCGMVKNEGEPGGGPFWVRDAEGRTGLQIVESVQVSKDPEQQKILQSATHFNPVDLVCGIKNRFGVKYDLQKFKDPSTSFIVHKSLEGKTIKALEHPGLWNGSMANWLTVFVEIPVSTFNPVKTITDLLKPNHRK